MTIPPAYQAMWDDLVVLGTVYADALRLAVKTGKQIDLAIAIEKTGDVTPADVASALEDHDLVVEIGFALSPTDMHTTVLILQGAAAAALLSIEAESDGDDGLSPMQMLGLGEEISNLLETVAERVRSSPRAPERVWLANIDTLSVVAGQVVLPEALANQPLMTIQYTLSAGAQSTQVIQLIGRPSVVALLGAAPLEAVPVAAPVMAAASAARPAPVASATPPPAAPPPSPAPRVQTAQFAPFGQPSAPAGGGQNIDLIRDVPLRITVELGRTSMTVREVLGLAAGSVIELDRLAGEPVDILANDRVIAHGEVVVVDENFGVRITDMVPASQRST